MTEQAGSRKFSWLGLFFGGAYYAGYGRLGKGLIMSALSSFPLAAIIVQVYAALRARKELPIGEQPFSWPKAVAAYALTTLLMLAFIAPPFKQSVLVSDVSGYWTDAVQNEVMIDFESEPPVLSIRGVSQQVELLDVDSGNGRLSFRLANGVVATLVRNWDSSGEGFTLSLVVPNTPPVPLAFVRRL